MSKLSASMLSPDAKNVISLCRALVISQKYPYRVRELQREYNQLEGARMDWKKYGFKNLEEFLSASGEFVLSKYQGETCITARPTKETAHIVSMVKRQRSTKKQLRKPRESDQSWNKSSYSSFVYPNIRNKSKAIMKSSGDSNNNSFHARPNGSVISEKSTIAINKTRPNGQMMSQISSTFDSHTQKQSTPEQPKNNHQTTDLRERLQTKQDSFETSSNKQLIDLSMKKSSKVLNTHVSASRAILEQKNMQHIPGKPNLQQRMQKFQNDCVRNVLTSPSPCQQKSPTSSPTTIFLKSALPSKKKINTTSNKLRGITTSVTKTSIQDRLKIVQQMPPASVDVEQISASRDPSSSSISNNSVISTGMENDEKSHKESVMSTVIFEFDSRTDSITELARYCEVRCISPPDYKFLKMKFSSRVQCRVLVNGVMYSTYPEEFETTLQAQVACANAAIQQIKIDEGRNLYPLCMDSDVELAMKIYQELCNHPHGIFCKNIPELFQATYQQTLPDHWLSIVQSARQFIIETTATDNATIVFANVKSSDSSSTSSVSDAEFMLLDRINLPWDEKYWNLYITHCTSTTEVWARIVGKEFSDQLDSIMTDVDLSMLTTKLRPPSIICGQIYLVSVSECWHRVRVENMNKTNGKCFCFFIDFGDEDWILMDQLYVCESRFLRLPPQAIPLSLYGLEDFAENPNAKIHLDQMLISRTLIGEVITKKETFELLNDAELDFNARIQIVLYDTSSNEDINVNPLLLTLICNDTPPPELKRTGVTNVNVTYINTNGEIYIQIKNIGLSYIQKLINQLVESKFNEEDHQVVFADLKKPDSLFLIQDLDDLKWYRGALVEEDNQIGSNEYNIFYVDIGKTKTINISRIFRLESLSAALSKFPRQALKVRLHNLPPIDETIVSRLRGLLPCDTPAIVKLCIHAIVPQVMIYRRFDANDGLFNVNEVVRIEYELESSLDLHEQQSNGTNDSNTNESRCNSADSSCGSIMSPITIPTSPLKKYDLPKLCETATIPPINEFFEVFVSMTSNPRNFVVQPYTEGPKLSELMNSLQEYCMNNDEFIPVDMIEVGQAYAAPNSDGIYHRVTVENVFDSSNIHVFFCDFGDFAVLSNDELKTLPAKYRTLPKQAVMAKLHGVKPKHCDWTVNDCMRFREITLGQSFSSIVKNISDDTVWPNLKTVELQLVDVQTEEDIYLHEILINEDRAVPDAVIEE